MLVACGITDADALASMNPQQLWRTVKPFIASNEGKRVIRSSPVPDLAEVTEWIGWARHARELSAA